MRGWIWIGAGVVLLAAVAFVPSVVGKTHDASRADVGAVTPAPMAPTPAPPTTKAPPTAPTAAPAAPEAAGTTHGYSAGTGALVAVFRGIGWLSMHGQPDITPKQAKAVLAVMNPLRAQPTLAEAQAVAAKAQLDKILTADQHKALAARLKGLQSAPQPGMMMPGASPQGQMPPGHPDMRQMPAGHPDMSKMPAGHPDMSQMPAGHPDMSKMPAGHPDMSKMPPGHPDMSQMPAGHPDMSKMPAGHPAIGQMPVAHPGHQSTEQLALPKDFNPLNEQHVTPQTAFIADMIHATFKALEVRAQE